MPRINFGGSQDPSGVFASLANADLERIQAGVRRAAAQAEKDQDANDQDFYSQWKNGKVSDDEWLAYIRKRLAEVAGDPEEQQKWADMLRTHEAAISDAQAETKFRLGKISAQQLLSHYRERMGDVDENSPAYRDLAERYQQVVDYAKGRSSGGGGGGGGDGGGGSGSRLAQFIQERQATQPSGYDPSGEDVIAPSSSFYGVGSVNYYLKTLQADQDRLLDLVDQYKRDPTLPYLTDHMTGQRIETNPDMLHALDNQYLRNQDAIATVYDAKRDPKGATHARTEKGYYISTYMVDHNTDRIEPAYSAFQRTLLSAWQTASNLSPDQRMGIYQQTQKMTQDFVDGAFPGEGGIGLRQFLGERSVKAQQESGTAETGNVARNLTADLPPELKASGAFLQVMQGWDALHQAVLNPNLSDEEREFYAQEAIRLIPGSVDPTTSVGARGERARLTESDVRNLIYGNPNSEAHVVPAGSPLGQSYTGPFATLVQRDGLDNVDPMFDGQRFVYEVNSDGSSRVVTADAAPTPDGAGLYLVPQGQDRSSLVQVAFKVGGRTVVGFAKPQQIPPNLLPPGMLVYSAINPLSVNKAGIKGIGAGALVPSEVIKQMGGQSWLNEQVRLGNISRVSPAWGVVVQSPGGGAPTIWYQDAKTGLLSTTLDLSATEKDPTTGGIAVSNDGVPSINAIPFASGSPIAFGLGVTRKEMANIVRQRVMSGALDLGDFRTRGAGTSVGGPPDLDSILSVFLRPGMRGRPDKHGGKGWGREDAALASDFDRESARAARAWMEQNTAARQREGGRVGGRMESDDMVGEIANSLKDFGAQVGVNLEGRDSLPALPSRRGFQAASDEEAHNSAIDAMRARESARQLKPMGLRPIFAPAAVERAPLPKQEPLESESPAPILGPKMPVQPSPVQKAARRQQMSTAARYREG